MTAEITQGKWQSEYMPHHKMYAIYGNQKFVAKVFDRQSEHCDLTSEEAKANAKLIAAAPQLLQALKLLTSEIQLSKLNVKKDFSLLVAHAEASKVIHSLNSISNNNTITI